MEKLKPCPFCGAEPMMQHIAYPNTEFWFVKCVNCSAEINNPSHSEEDAVLSWNKRDEIRCKDCDLFHHTGCPLALFKGLPKENDYCSYRRKKEH